jgi:hypothetical protein
MVQASAGFFTYFYILNDYGIRPGTLFGLETEPGVIPANSDVYDPTNLAGFRGNTNVKGGSKLMDLSSASDEGARKNLIRNKGEFARVEGVWPTEVVKLDWNGNSNNMFDLRLFYFYMSPESWSKCRWSPDQFMSFYATSHMNSTQICYTVEGLRYA